MSRIIYVNGRYLPYAEATVHVEDRGYQFSDGVYEAFALHNGHMVFEEPHLDRLERSLGELRMAPPMVRNALKVVMRETIRRDRSKHGILYLQVTRGVAPRNHGFPEGVASSLVMIVHRGPPYDAEAVSRGITVITVPDIRWKRVDIKTISLLPNVLARQNAYEAGAFEAWQVDADGMVTEGTLSNAWIVSEEGDLITRQPDHAILDGITRRTLLDMARDDGITFKVRPFSVAEAMAAREAFLTSSSSFIKPVIRIDGQDICDGKTGPLTRKLIGLYADHLETLGPPS
jgi:D-alanine transaminase